MKTTMNFAAISAATLVALLAPADASVIRSGDFNGTYTSAAANSVAFTPVAGNLYGVSAAIDISPFTWAADDQTANFTALSFNGSPTTYGNGQSWYTYGGGVVDRFVNTLSGGGNPYIGGTTGAIYSGFSLDTRGSTWTIKYYYGGMGFDANSVYQGATAYKTVANITPFAITQIDFSYNPYNATGGAANAVVSSFVVTADTNLIDNGSFEQTTISTQTNAQQPGWNYITDTYYWGGKVDFGSDNNWNAQGTNTPFTASQGTQFAVLNGTDWGTLLKTADANKISLTAGQQYTFSFDTRLLSAYNGDYSAAIAPASSMKLAVVLAHNEAGDPNNVNYVDSRIVVDNLFSWNSNSFTFTAGANDSSVRVFVYTLSGDNEFSHVFTAIDNIQLNAVPPSFGAWAATNAGGQAANLDYDSDGVSNGVEYFMNAASGFTANPGLVGNTVNWPNGGKIPSSAYGSQFEVQTSTDLANWSAVASDDINLSNTAGALTWKVASISNGNMDSFPSDLPSSWVVSGGTLTSASSADNSPFTNKFADNGSSWIIDDSTDTTGTAGFSQAFSNKTNYPSVEVNFDFKLTELTGGTWGIQFDGAGASAIAASSVHYRIDASGQFAINAGPGTGVITNILTLEADKWYNVRATFTTTAVNTGSNEGAGVQSGTITPAGGSPVSWSNVPLLNTSLGFSRLLVRDRNATSGGDLLLDNVSVAPQGKEFVRLKVTPN